MLYNATHPLDIRPYDTFSMKKKKFLKRLAPRKVSAISWGYCAGPIGMINKYFLDNNHYGISPLVREAFTKFLISSGRTVSSLMW